MDDNKFDVLFETLEELFKDYIAFESGKEYQDIAEQTRRDVRNEIRKTLERYIQEENEENKIDAYIVSIEEVSKKYGVSFSDNTKRFLKKEISRILTEAKKVKLRPLTGTGVMIFKDKKILLGKRKGSHGAGEWAFPGGHLELGESFEECVKKEVEEETGIEIWNVTFYCIANVTHYMKEDVCKHYIHHGFYALWQSGEPEVREPNKCEEWRWFSLDDLPEPLFEMVKVMLDSWFRGTQFYDRGEVEKLIESFDIKCYLKRSV